MFKLAIKRATLALLLGLASLSAQAAVTGAGASFPYPIYAKWASEFATATGNKINYQSIGSGGGQKQIIAKTVDFGASDDPLSQEKLDQNALLQFPAVIGGTVPVVNLEGIKPGQLKLSGEVLADIFLGKITSWNDVKIQALNKGVKLPETNIIVIHRSDGSGTTFGWTNYLSKVSSEWKAKVGEGKSVKWPTGQGGKGNEGVAAYVARLANTIGYVEYAYAKQNNLAWVSLQNQAGKFVQPEQKSFAAAAVNADWKGTPGMGVVLTNEKGDDSWPITATTFILLNKEVAKPTEVKTALEFFDWAWKNGAEMAAQLDYVPLPKEVTDTIRQAWSQELKTTDGKAIW